MSSTITKTPRLRDYEAHAVINGYMLYYTDHGTVEIIHPITKELIVELIPNLKGSLYEEDDSVSHLIRLPNGNFATVTGNEIHIWDIHSGECLRTLKGHPVWISSLLPNGYIASGSGDTICIWEPNTGRRVYVLNGHTSFIDSLTVLPNGYLVSASRDKTIRIWDVSVGSCVYVITGHDKAVHHVTALSDGTIVSASSDNIIKVWEYTTNNCVQVIQIGDDRIESMVALTNDYIATNHILSHNIRIWNPVTGECVHKIDTRPNISRLSLLPSGQLIGFDFINDKVYIWDVPTSVDKDTTSARSESLQDLINEFQRVKAKKQELMSELQKYDDLQVRYTALESQCKKLSSQIKSLIDA